MARLVFILGESGTGKSTSLRNLTPEDVSVISVQGKELPFPTAIKPRYSRTYDRVIADIKSASKPIVVLDDANYLMTNFEFATVAENGYGKFARNALGMVNVFNAIIDKDTDQTYYIFAHSEKGEDGQLRFKTSGKMVSEKYNPAGVTNIVLEAMYDDQSEEFVFRTKADGHGVKSPLGMFDQPYIENDLKVVNQIINDYYKKEK